MQQYPARILRNTAHVTQQYTLSQISFFLFLLLPLKTSSRRRRRTPWDRRTFGGIFLLLHRKSLEEKHGTSLKRLGCLFLSVPSRAFEHGGCQSQLQLQFLNKCCSHHFASASSDCFYFYFFDWTEWEIFNAYTYFFFNLHRMF